jgi:hypothetical protein
MKSYKKAMFYLNQCEESRLDRNKDDVPCKSTVNREKKLYLIFIHTIPSS